MKNRRSDRSGGFLRGGAGCAGWHGLEKPAVSGGALLSLTAFSPPDSARTSVSLSR